MVDTRLPTVSEKPAFMIALGWYANLVSTPFELSPKVPK